MLSGYKIQIGSKIKFFMKTITLRQAIRWVIAIGLLPVWLSAQNHPPIDSLHGAFANFYVESTDTLYMEIETDVKDLLKTMYEEEYRDAALRYRNAAGEMESAEIELRTRGNSRKEICYFPPLKIKFDKDWLRERGLNPKLRDIKLVVQCSGGKRYEEYLLREFLAYRLYEIHSPFSLRTRLLHLRIIDSEGKRKAYDHYAFLLEDIDEMAARWSGLEINRESIRSSMLEDDPLMVLALFQYMIGNSDWSIPNLHNLKCIKLPMHIRMAPVPYDFDYSGLVNSSYAVPHESFPVSNVRQRFYRGPTCLLKDLEELIPFFMEKRQAVTELCEQFDYLPENNRKDMVDYLDEFYELLEKPEQAQREFQGF